MKSQNWILITFVCLNVRFNTNAYKEPYNLVRKSYECKYGTQLKDSFYQSLGLAKMNFNQSMSLLRKIYLDTNNCTSVWCKCTKSGKTKLEFANFFLNQTNFEAIKAIIFDYNIKMTKYLKPMSDLLASYDDGQRFPTLVNFSVPLEWNYKEGFYTYFSKDFPQCGFSNDTKHWVNKI